MKHLSLFYLCVSVCVCVWGGGGGNILNQGELNHNKYKFLCIIICFLELCHEIYQNSNSESCHHIE